MGVEPSIAGVEFEGFIASKAFDSSWIIAELNARGAKVDILQRLQRILPLAIDKDLYKSRHLMENFFWKLKGFKRIATRAKKPAVLSKQSYISTRQPSIPHESQPKQKKQKYKIRA